MLIDFLALHCDYLMNDFSLFSEYQLNVKHLG
jgi:hypothetical protein